jgi:hypothetical protein
MVGYRHGSRNRGDRRSPIRRIARGMTYGGQVIHRARLSGDRFSDIRKAGIGGPQPSVVSTRVVAPGGDVESQHRANRTALQLRQA